MLISELPATNRPFSRQATPHHLPAPGHKYMACTTRQCYPARLLRLIVNRKSRRTAPFLSSLRNASQHQFPRLRKQAGLFCSHLFFRHLYGVGFVAARRGLRTCSAPTPYTHPACSPSVASARTLPARPAPCTPCTRQAAHRAKVFFLFLSCIFENYLSIL